MANFGLNPITNKKIATATGYSGDFGQGQFDTWLNSDAGAGWKGNKNLGLLMAQGDVAEIEPAKQVTATSAAPVTWNATTSAVDPATETVEQRVTGLLARDNPMTQQVKTGAKQAANAMGLLNTTMAVSAGEDAAIRNVLPIATQDAATYSNTRLANQSAQNAAGQSNAQMGTQVNVANAGAANSASQFNAGAENNVSLQKAGLLADVWKTNKDTESRTALADKDAASRITLANMDATSRQAIVDTEAKYKGLMQQNASASDLYTQTLQNIGNLQINDSLSPEAKDTAIKNQATLLNQGLAAIGVIQRLDLGSLLTGAPAQEAAAPEQPEAPAYGNTSDA